MPTYKNAKLRYLRKQFEAMGTSCLELREHLPADAEMRPMSGESDLAWAEQWYPINARIPPNGGWDWPNLRSHYSRDPENLCVAMWARNENLLAGLMIATLNQTAVKIEFIKSSPSSNPPLRNKVLLLGIDTAIRYADGTGREQLWIVEPANEDLTEHYVEVYGFKSATTQQGTRICRREV